MDTPDFSLPELTITLPIPFWYRDLRTKEEIKVDKAVVRRMTAPDLSRFKSAVARNTDESSSYVVAIKEFLENCIEDFIGADGEKVKGASLPILVGRLPFPSAEKIFRYGVMLTRESSLFKTFYKCYDCGDTTLFDLDPTEDIPDDIERDRLIQQNYMEFYSEKAMKGDERTFIVILDNPVDIQGYDEDDNLIDDQMTVMEVEWPTLGTYLKVVKDSRKAKDSDTWVIFENLVRINDYPEEVTKKIKKNSGYDTVMKIRNRDWSKVINELDRYGIEIDHSYDCIHCGYTNEVRFDETNFFDFLKS